MLKLTLAALLPFLSILGAFSSTAHSLELDFSHRFVKRQSVEDWGQKTSMVHWRLLTQGRRYDRVTDASTVYNTTLSAVIQYKFYDELRFVGAYDAVLQTGNAQSRFGDLSPRTGLFLSESYFLISPFAKTRGDSVSIEVGALNQSRIVRNKVLISGNSFPGVSEFAKFNVGSFDVSFRAQQSIPFSQVQNADFAEREQTPYFLTESLNLSYESSNLDTSVQAGLFNYSTLPSAVADQSRILGNSVTGEGGVSEFLYDFRGWFANFRLNALLADRILLQLRGFLVENTEAPETLNRGQDFSAALHYTSNKTQWGPSFGVFSLEPDVTPAFYTASIFGNNNRDGWYAGFDLFIRRPEKIRFRVEYVNASLLNPNALQEDQESIFVTLQTHFKKLGAW